MIKSENRQCSLQSYSKWHHLWAWPHRKKVDIVESSGQNRTSRLLPSEPSVKSVKHFSHVFTFIVRRRWSSCHFAHFSNMLVGGVSLHHPYHPVRPLVCCLLQLLPLLPDPLLQLLQLLIRLTLTQLLQPCRPRADLRPAHCNFWPLQSGWVIEDAYSRGVQRWGACAVCVGWVERTAVSVVYQLTQGCVGGRGGGSGARTYRVLKCLLMLV